MRIRTNFAVVVLAVLTLGVAACGDDDDDGGEVDAGQLDAGQLDGAQLDGAQLDGPPAAACSGIFADECGTCAEGSCCDELTACKDIANCVDCLTGAQADETICSEPALVAAASAAATCIDTSCAKQCAAEQCNPVTNDGCAESFACDQNTEGRYECFAPPNDVALCGACEPVNGPWCVAGSFCSEERTCTRYCCADTDCGANGTCDMVVPGGVGLCFTTGTQESACDAPAVSPSGGTCFEP